MRKNYLISTLCLTLVCQQAFAQSKLVLVGDSTVATYSTGEKQGWGYALQSYFDSKKITVKNHAASGRSSKSFIKEGLWDKALKENPKFVFIQFGHNDSKDDPNYRTNPNSDYKTYLRHYINDTEKKGGTPILVSPPERRRWSGSKISRSLDAYVKAMKQVASEEGVILLDLWSQSIKELEKLGESKAKKYYTDTTHTNKEGAKWLAGLLVQEIRQKAPQLASSLKNPPTPTPPLTISYSNSNRSD